MTAAQRKTVWSLVALGGVIFAIWKLWPLLKEKLGGSSSGTGVSGSGASNYYPYGDPYLYQQPQQNGLNQLLNSLLGALQGGGGSKGGFGASAGPSAGNLASLSAPASPYSPGSLLTPSANSITGDYFASMNDLSAPAYDAGTVTGLGGSQDFGSIFQPTYDVVGPGGDIAPTDAASAGFDVGSLGAAGGAYDYSSSMDPSSYGPSIDFGGDGGAGNVFVGGGSYDPQLFY